MQLKAFEAAERTLNLKLEKLEVRERPETEAAFLNAAPCKVDALLSSLTGHNTKLLSRPRFGAAPPRRDALNRLRTRRGIDCLRTKSSRLLPPTERSRRQNPARPNPADLPIEKNVTEFEFVLNIKTAKLLGVTVPPFIQFGATR